MYKGKKVAVVIPAYNEETQIERVFATMPEFVDLMIVVDDDSKDRTTEITREYQAQRDDIELIRHQANKGVGAAIATGYKYARDNNFDVAVVMAGDGQMAPEDLPAILDPVVDGTADYSKGNRLFTGEAYRKIPKVRYFGNAFLSLLTKIASGYWHVADSQSGYTAINSKALKSLDWDEMYPWYGQPNDILVRLNVLNFKVTDVPVEPVYNIGEKSGIKLNRVVFSISWLLVRLFLWRMKEKYVIRDFHPLVFFYLFGFFFSTVSFLLAIRMFYIWGVSGSIPPINALAAFFSFVSGSLFSLFAMWFDMESNKDLK